MQLIQLTDGQGLTVSLRYLSACLAFSERGQEDDVAVAITEDGFVVASEAAWQRHSLELLNFREELIAKQQFRHFALASARDIRSLLHDAEAARQQRQQVQQNAAFDHTRAHQSLEDLVSHALAVGASDIHLSFNSQHAALSLRVHGRMISYAERPRETLVAAIAAALNTRSDDFHQLFDEQRLSSASINVVAKHEGQGQRIRLRVQKSPIRNGFAVTMRIQQEQQAILRFDQLGFAASLIAQLRLLLEQPCGLFIVAGPTGQGKTTSLAALNLMIPPDLKVISLEDPIEIIQPHIEQKPVLAGHAELNFANMVKVALREDPDVISISEIRDAETAHAAYTAALTGHLVTATIHAHDCLGVIQRLNDLGITPNMLAQSGVLRGILAQRLLKQACPACHGEPREPTCQSCQGTGVGRRKFVAEFIAVDAAFEEALRGQTLTDYWRQRRAAGWQSLSEQMQATQEVELCD